MPLSSAEEPAHLRTALESVFDQTRLPDEVLLVQDRALPDGLDAVVEDFGEAYPDRIETVTQTDGDGLGAALRFGVRRCSHDLVARMDSDDISVPDRFERQLRVFEDDPSIDLVGGYTAEFERDPDAVTAIGRVPTSAEAVAVRARYRNPINHPTVMFRREAVQSAGNYRPAHGMEDYDLWVRMLLSGHVLTNIPEVLIKYRVDDGYQNRGGRAAVEQELKLQYDFLRNGFIDPLTLGRNLLTRVPVRMLPGPVRDALIARFIRDPV